MVDEDWSEEQKKALKQWKQKDRSERHPHDLLPNENQGYNRGVTKKECREMRVTFKKDSEVTIKSMVDAEFDYSQTTIAEHVFDRCSHDIDEEAAESPMGSIDPENFVGVQECMRMRKYYREDGNEEIVNVKEEFGKTYGQTYHHLVGRCKCEHDEPNIRSEEREGQE